MRRKKIYTRKLVPVWAICSMLLLGGCSSDDLDLITDYGNNDVTVALAEGTVQVDDSSIDGDSDSAILGHDLFGNGKIEWKDNFITDDGSVKVDIDVDFNRVDVKKLPVYEYTALNSSTIREEEIVKNLFGDTAEKRFKLEARDIQSPRRRTRENDTRTCARSRDRRTGDLELCAMGQTACLVEHHFRRNVFKAARRLRGFCRTLRASHDTHGLGRSGMAQAPSGDIFGQVIWRRRRRRAQPAALRAICRAGREVDAQFGFVPSQRKGRVSAGFGLDRLPVRRRCHWMQFRSAGNRCRTGEADATHCRRRRVESGGGIRCHPKDFDGGMHTVFGQCRMRP